MPGEECLDDDEMLSFVDGLLPRARRREVLLHIDGCEACRELAATLAGDPDASSLALEEQRDPTPSTSDLEDGEVISQRFVVDKALGRGAVGTVFRAHDRVLGTDVALKLMRREDSRARKASLDRELKAGQKVRHPNVCRLYDAGTTEHYDFITMELIDGETLAQTLSRGEPSPERVAQILEGIAAGLGAAHAQGIVHRDLKPANVMVERGTNRIVLTDFGFAADLDSNQSRRLVGTPAYWAPEQARGERPTTACDVYSFGVLAYRLLTGRDFSLSDPNALHYVPARHRRAVARCVEARPSARFADAREAGAAFAARKRPVWPVALATVTVIGVVGYVAKSREAPRPPSSTVVAVQPTVVLVVSSSPEIPASPPPPVASPEVIPTVSANSPATSTRQAHPSVIATRPNASAVPSAVAIPSLSASPRSPSDLLYRK